MTNTVFVLERATVHNHALTRTHTLSKIRRAVTAVVKRHDVGSLLRPSIHSLFLGMYSDVRCSSTSTRDALDGLGGFAPEILHARGIECIRLYTPDLPQQQCRTQHAPLCNLYPCPLLHALVARCGHECRSQGRIRSLPGEYRHSRRKDAFIHELTFATPPPIGW